MLSFINKVSAENGPLIFNFFLFNFIIAGLIILSSSLLIKFDSQCGFKPVTAKVETSSLLGGDSKISIISNGVPISNQEYLPQQNNCPSKIILCEGDEIQGAGSNNISELTGDDATNKIIYLSNLTLRSAHGLANAERCCALMSHQPEIAAPQ